MIGLMTSDGAGKGGAAVAIYHGRTLDSMGLENPNRVAEAVDAIAINYPELSRRICVRQDVVRLRTRRRAEVEIKMIALLPIKSADPSELDAILHDLSDLVKPD